MSARYRKSERPTASLRVFRPAQQSPDYLHVTLNRGPRLGGFLHPTCYGVPGLHSQGNMRSHQPYYVPTSIFEGDGLIVTQSYAAAYFRGRSASGSSGGGETGLNPIKAFTALADATNFLRNAAPQIVKLPGLVPYIGAQLTLVHLLEDGDGGSAPGPPTPRLFLSSATSIRTTTGTPMSTRPSRSQVRFQALSPIQHQCHWPLLPHICASTSGSATRGSKSLHGPSSQRASSP